MIFLHKMYCRPNVIGRYNWDGACGTCRRKIKAYTKFSTKTRKINLEELDIDRTTALKSTYAVIRHECVDDEINIVQNSHKSPAPPKMIMDHKVSKTAQTFLSS